MHQNVSFLDKNFKIFCPLLHPNKLTSWAQKWKMEFNVAKCKVMLTHSLLRLAS